MSINRPAKSAAIAAALIVAASAQAARAQNPQELQDLKRQIEVLNQRVQELEKQQREHPPAPTPAPAPAPVTAGDFPGSIKVPGTNASFKIGGYVKGDFIYDFLGSAGDVADPKAIPLDGTPGAARRGQTRVQARETRANLDVRSPTDWGPLRIFVEGDFYGNVPANSEIQSNSYGLRLRHAYGTLGPFLAGQTNSVFRDPDSEGETIDFQGPSGVNATRQAQFRYTYTFEPGLTLAVALENPETDFSNSTLVGGTPYLDTSRGIGFDHLPDLTGQLRWQGPWGHVAFRGVGRDLGVKNPGIDNSAFGWGLGLSGHYVTFGKDNIVGQVNYGDGIGRYIADAQFGAVAFNQARDVFDTQSAFGAELGYQHWWRDNLRSNLVFGYTHIDNADMSVLPASVRNQLNKELKSAHVNLIWSPVASVDTGIEYIYEERLVETGQNGSLSRFQVAAKYKF